MLLKYVLLIVAYICLSVYRVYPDVACSGTFSVLVLCSTGRAHISRFEPFLFWLMTRSSSRILVPRTGMNQAKAHASTSSQQATHTQTASNGKFQCAGRAHISRFEPFLCWFMTRSSSRTLVPRMNQVKAHTSSQQATSD